ncbi:MAG: recombinase family protein [Magnetococcales bacterium]|nr:recombinase family protein [Magnetococcales bacterium]
MSTEHQQYSTDNQSDIIKEYAEQNGMEIVRTYADEGKSGLNIEGRASLQQMLEDVESGNADYEVILIYDISRWGRFQDADQSAYYEYVIKRKKVRIEYCAEMFKNDGSTASVIVKNVKRVMAGEYSRELSKKVFHGQCRLIQMGYRQGGMAGFGLRRMLVDQQGTPKGELKLGEKKSLQTERVVLVEGPEEEVATVRWIYDQFLNHGRMESQIAQALNRQGILSDLGRPWNRGTIKQVLTNEKYIGNNIYNRRSFKLKQERVNNPPDMWIRHDDAFPALIGKDVFYQVQGIMLDRARRYSSDELISLLAELYKQKGFLSGIIIDQSDHLPSSSVYQSRFGNLLTVYRLVGFTPDRDYSFLEVNRRLREWHPKVVSEVITQIEEMGGGVDREDGTDLLNINQEFSSSLVIARHKETPAGSSRWFLRFDASLRPDITIAVRMDSNNREIRDYYLFPNIDTSRTGLRLAIRNGIDVDAFRFDNLNYFFEMAKRVPIRRSA